MTCPGGLNIAHQFHQAPVSGQLVQVRYPHEMHDDLHASLPAFVYGLGAVVGHGHAAERAHPLLVAYRHMHLAPVDRAELDREPHVIADAPRRIDPVQAHCRALALPRPAAFCSSAPRTCGLVSASSISMASAHASGTV